MRYVLLGIMVLALSAPLTGALAPTGDKNGAGEDRSAARQLHDIVADYQARRSKAAKAFAAAATEQEKAQALAQEPKLEDYTHRILALVNQHRHESFATEALSLVVQRAFPGPDADRALDLLLADHVDSPVMGQVALTLAYSGSPTAEPRLRTLLATSKNHSVQGIACLFLARCVKMKPEMMKAPSPADVERCNHEAEALLKRVADQYGDVSFRGDKLAHAVAGELHEIHNLTVGKPAPDIEGIDVHGKPFKLSDYRGKVVMLDFWGHW